jgi:hypothetical protein
MTEILPSAAYVRNVDALNENALRDLHTHSGFESSETSRRIWELLETPQTIETLCRVITDSSSADQEGCGRAVKLFLADLYDQDLIQVSPDS